MYTPKNKIIVFDTTLRDGEQAPECTMTPLMKSKVAEQIESMNVDVIEAGFPGSSHEDYEAVNRVARERTRAVIAGLTKCSRGMIATTAKALEPALQRGKGRIHTFIATSPQHMKCKLAKTPEQVYKMACDGVAYARTLSPDVEFSCEDFTRSEFAFLNEMILGVIKAGATTINLPDTVGYCVPG